MKEIVLGIEGMTLEQLVAIARRGAQVRMAEESIKGIREARELINKWVQEEKIVYGVTTGFGGLSDTVISKKDTRILQQNILMSHAVGVGNFLDGVRNVDIPIAIRFDNLGWIPDHRHPKSDSTK